MNVSKKIVNKLRSFLTDDQTPYALHEPSFTGNELHYVSDCIRTGWVSSVGSYVGRFESELSAYTGIKYAVATVNGTAALHTCFLINGLQANEEVLVPSLTFIATVNAIAYCGAIPHFVDSDVETFGVDPVS